MIELNYTNINKAMNISVQSVLHVGEKGRRISRKGMGACRFSIITEIPELRPLVPNGDFRILRGRHTPEVSVTSLFFEVGNLLGQEG